MKKIIDRQTLASLSLLLLTALLYGWYAWISPWVGDDIEYAYMAEWGSRDMGERAVRTIGDVFRSGWRHYFMINGRTPAHLLVQYFCGIGGQYAFALCNGLVYIIFTLATGCIAFRCSPRALLRRPLRLLATAVLIGLTFYTSYTPTCQIGYVWMFTLALLFLPLFFAAEKPKAWWLPGGIAFALLAGWGQESLNFGLCAALCLYAVGHRRDLTRHQWWLLCSFCLGALLLGLAPGNFRRLASCAPGTGNRALWNSLLQLRLCWALLLAVGTLCLLRRKQIRDIYRHHSLLWQALGFNLLGCAGVGVIGHRQWLGAELLSLLLLVQLVQESHCSGNMRRAALLLLAGAAATLQLRHARFLTATRTAYDHTWAACLAAAEGDTVRHHFDPDSRLWPGSHHLATIERKARCELNKRVHILPDTPISQ